MTRTLVRLCLLVSLLLVASCGSTPPSGPTVGLKLDIVSGNQQSGEAGAALPLPLVIRLTDAAGNPLTGRRITWLPTGASVTPGEGFTDSDGRAETQVTLRPTGGTVTVRATAVGATSVVFSLLAVGTEEPIQPIASIPIPANYGVHDTYLRDGLAFVSAWNTGLRIYDVGNGVQGGTPASPVLLSTTVTPANGNPCICVHNAWWFHNPVTGEKRYVFVGQEVPLTFGQSSAGDLHVLDVSDLANPQVVGVLSVPGAGVHNFWMDEAAQVLYAAYYDGGVIKVDVSGTLSGNLNSRILQHVQPGGPGNTYVWGVYLANNTLYVSDMLNGLWALDPATLATRAGGNNALDRFTSEVWVVGSYAYTGTWNSRFNARGNQVKVWNVAGNGVAIADTFIVSSGIGTVSDIGATPDGRVLVVTGESGAQGGLYLYSLVDSPTRPRFLGRQVVSGGLHTGKVMVHNGRTYVFGAKNATAGSGPALLIYDITGAVAQANQP